MSDQLLAQPARYLHNTRHTQVTNPHVLNGIQTRDPNSQVEADVRLRPHCLVDVLDHTQLDRPGETPLNE